MRIRKEKVPVALRRKAAQLLESLRGTPMGEGLESATLADDVTPMYRPDMQGVAYYEFAFDRKDGVQAERRGFIVVSAGDHDFPRAHWSAGRPPVSDELVSKAGRKAKKIARIYKVDSLGYVGEDDGGEEAARAGEVPLLFTTPEDAQPTVISESSTPSTTEADAKSGGQAKHALKKNSDAKPGIQIRRDVASWKQLKNEYGKTLGKPLLALRGQARKAWEIDALAEKFGEGLFAGEPFRVALLEPGAKWDASGDGAALTDIRLIEHGGGAAALELLARDVPPAGGADLTLVISYPSGLEEKLKFFIVSPQGTSEMRGKLAAPDK